MYAIYLYTVTVVWTVYLYTVHWAWTVYLYTVDSGVHCALYTYTQQTLNLYSLHLTSRTQLTVFTNCPRHQFAPFTQPPNSLYSQLLAHHLKCIALSN